MLQMTECLGTILGTTPAFWLRAKTVKSAGSKSKSYTSHDAQLRGIKTRPALWTDKSDALIKKDWSKLPSNHGEANKPAAAAWGR